MSKKLCRSSHNKMFAGVCGGIGEYFDIDPTIVRIIWLICALGGIGLIAYLICWLVMPLKESDYYSSVDESSTENDATHIDSEKSKSVFGIALIIIGTVFLFDKFFVWFDLDLMIPLGIIVIGIVILFKKG